MRNTVNNFGYLESGDVRRRLLFPQTLRGCNKEELTELFNLDFIPDDILKLLPKVPLEGLESGIKSFTYQKLTTYNNEVIDKFVYLFLIMNDLGNQIYKVLIETGSCIINFDSYINPDYPSNDVIINFLNEILKFRGYYTELMDNEILVLNCNYRVTTEQVDRLMSTINKPGITVYVTDTLENKEELIYRCMSELLNINNRYSDLTSIWLESKNSLDTLHAEDFEDLHNLGYKIFYVYACLNSYEDIDNIAFSEDTESNIKVLLDSLELDEHKEMLQLATDLVDTDCVIGLDENMYAKECLVAREILEESLGLVENILDGYYAPDMKPTRCTRLFEKDLQLFSYEMLRTSAIPSTALVIPKIAKHTEIETLEIETEETYEDLENEDVHVETKRTKGFKRYLPIIALTIVVLIAARLVTM